MNTLDFTLYQNDSDLNGNPFVILQAAKGKHLYNKIIIRSDEFKYLEGVIWDKHREYGNSTQSKINAIDWFRITDGFKEAVDELTNCSNKEELIEILKLRNHHQVSKLAAVYDDKDSLINFFHEVTEWINKNTPRKTHIMIIKDI